MPPPLIPAIDTVSTEAESMEDVSMEVVSAAGRPKPAVSPKRPPKMGAGSAWAAWQATGAASAGSEFLQSVSSWMEGTAAQLLRRAWPVGAKRPTCTQVQERLRYYLEVLAHDEQATYLDALGAARRSVIEELRDAARLARAVGRS